MDEKNIREIANAHSWPEDEFLNEIKQFIDAYGYSEDGALAQAQRHFTRKFPNRTLTPSITVKVPPEIQTPAKPPTPNEPKTPIQIDSRLAAWLVQCGFSKGPNGSAYSKTGLLGDGAIIKLVVDFKNSEKGNRYGLRFDEVNGKWVNDLVLHDHPELLTFKAYRDKLLEAEKPEPIKATPKKENREISTGRGNQQLSLLPPEVEEARELEQRDESQIIKELKGELKEAVLSQMFYDFTYKGRHVVGLSYAGVKAAIRRMGHVEIVELKIDEKPDAWLVLIKARDKLRDLDAYGVAWQPKKFPSGEENPFGLIVAVSKAQRNVWRVFIDEKMVTEAWKTHLEGIKNENILVTRGR